MGHCNLFVACFRIIKIFDFLECNDLINSSAESDKLASSMEWNWQAWLNHLTLFNHSCHFIDATPSPIQPFLYCPGSEAQQISSISRIIRDNYRYSKWIEIRPVHRKAPAAHPLFVLWCKWTRAIHFVWISEYWRWPCSKPRISHYAGPGWFHVVFNYGRAFQVWWIYVY